MDKITEENNNTIRKNKYEIIIPNIHETTKMVLDEQISETEIERRIMEMAIRFNQYRLVFTNIKIHPEYLENIDLGMPHQYNDMDLQLKVNLDKAHNGTIVFDSGFFCPIDKFQQAGSTTISIEWQGHVYPIKKILDNNDFYKNHSKKYLQIEIFRAMCPGVPIEITSKKIIRKRKYGENFEEYDVEETLTKKRRIDC